MGFHVAVVGATGNVGREILDILAERGFPADRVTALASRRSMGTEISFGDRTLKCQSLETADFSNVDICLMSAGGDVSREWAPRIARAGAVVIDNSSAFRMDPDVPLIVPEVNADAAAGFTSKRGIIANPNCSTIAARRCAEAAARARAGSSRVVVSTYQSVSGAGKEAMDELFSQTKARVFARRSQSKPRSFPSAWPSTSFRRSTSSWKTASTKEEWKMMAETKKILDPEDQARRHLRARAGVHRALRNRCNIEFEDADFGR